MLGTWVTEGDFVFAGTNNATHNWPKGGKAATTVTPQPAVVVTQQQDRQISGYVVSASNRTPFHAIIKHSGAGLVGHGPYGILTADIDGDTMEWCFASTLPNVDAVACNMFRHQTTK